MSRERLEESVKAIMDNYPPERYTILRNAIDYIIQQAERFEKMKEEFAQDIDFKRREVLKLKEQAQSLESEIADFKKLVKYHKDKQKEAEDLNEPYRHRNKELKRRVQELEKYAQKLQSNIYDTDQVLFEVNQDRKRYREALERIANHEVYGIDIRCGDELITDAGKMARQALKGDCIHCNGKGFNGLDHCPNCIQGKAIQENTELEHQNKRYREALKKISSPVISVQFADIFNMKQVARQALEGEE